MRKIWKTFALAATAALSLGIPAGSRAHTEAMLEVISEFSGYLSAGDTQTYTINLSSGSYGIAAEGDSINGDLDLRVYDSYGYSIGSDTLADNLPVVEFVLLSSDQIVIEVSNYKGGQGFDGIITQR